MIAGNRQLNRGSGRNKKQGVPATVGASHTGALYTERTQVKLQPALFFGRLSSDSFRGLMLREHHCEHYESVGVLLCT